VAASALTGAIAASAIAIATIRRWTVQRGRDRWMDWGGRIHRVWTFCGEAARFQQYSGLLRNRPVAPSYDFLRKTKEQ
jgi:hypothetical protein